MTGELTLTGQVLPVGGIREKVIAARRAGLKQLILPAANQRDYDELPAYLKKGIKVDFAAHYNDVYAITLGGV
jgi:ATP-dependent Lon protease